MFQFKPLLLLFFQLDSASAKKPLRDEGTTTGKVSHNKHLLDVFASPPSVTGLRKEETCITSRSICVLVKQF